MLCQHCNTNEADYHFVVQENLKLHEVHLCADCASRLYQQYQSYLSGWQMTAQPSWTATAFQWPRQGEERRMPDSIDEDFSHRRLLTELRTKLQKAVDEEDYETAAKLRDEINKEKNRVQSPTL